MINDHVNRTKTLVICLSHVSYITPITSKFLDTGYFFGLEFAEGWIFGQVMRHENLFYRPYEAINSAGSTIDIAADSSQSELRFYDPRNTDVDLLFLDTQTDRGFPWFLHGAIGIKPQYIRAYLRYPETKGIPGKFPKGGPIRPQSGEDLGYIDSINSPYTVPSDQVEIVIVPNVHLGVEYYNIDKNRAHRPVLNLQFRLYWFKPILDENTIIQFIRGKIPWRPLTVGFENRVPFIYTDWRVQPLPNDEFFRLQFGGSE